MRRADRAETRAQDAPCPEGHMRSTAFAAIMTRTTMQAS